jgi:hypothetical protein
VRIAVRHLRKSPGFTIVAVTMLAVGIGVNTTVFSLMNAVLLRPLALRDSDRVVRVVVRSTTGGASGRRFSGPEFNDYRERATTLEDLSAVNLATFGLDADGRTDQLLGEIVSGGYLSLLGIRPIQGRLLADTDDRPGSPPAAVISDALWRHRFGGEAVLGRSVLLNRNAYTIVGVAEPSAVGSFVGVPVDVWVPIETSGQLLGVNWRTDRAARSDAGRPDAARNPLRARGRSAVDRERDLARHRRRDPGRRRPPSPLRGSSSSSRQHSRPAISGASSGCFSRCCSGWWRSCS